MSSEAIGKQSIKFNNPPAILSRASVVGEMEGEGPLSSYFDQIEHDPTFGQESWELGESEMVRRAVQTAISKSGLTKEDIRYIFFVVSQLLTHGFQREIVVGEMIIKVFFDDIKPMVLFLIIMIGHDSAVKKREGIQQNRFGYEIHSP